MLESLKGIQTLSPWTKSYDVTIQMKPLRLCFQMVSNLGIFGEFCPWQHLALKGSMGIVYE